MTEHDLTAVALPKLDEGQMALLERCLLTTRRQFRAGEKLFEEGDRDVTFFVVKSGEVEIVDESGDVPRVVTVLGRGEFTGDVVQPRRFGRRRGSDGGAVRARIPEGTVTRGTVPRDRSTFG